MMREHESSLAGVGGAAALVQPGPRREAKESIQGGFKTRGGRVSSDDRIFEVAKSGTAANQPGNIGAPRERKRRPAAREGMMPAARA
jgi:hypothetical protein